jgi:hypothetical protein
VSQLQMVIQRPADFDAFVLAARALPLDKPLMAELKPHKRKRSLDQNALYWMWLTELSRYLTGKGRKFATKEWCHDAMRHSFLGYERKELIDVTTGEVQARQSLRSTTRLQTGEFTFYLEQIEAWALNIGCLLPVPEHSEYMKLKREQNQ